MRKSTLRRVISSLEGELREILVSEKWERKGREEAVGMALALRTERNDLKAKLKDAGFERSGGTVDVHTADLQRQLEQSQRQVMDLTTKLKEYQRPPSDEELAAHRQTPRDAEILRQRMVDLGYKMDAGVKPVEGFVPAITPEEAEET